MIALHFQGDNFQEVIDQLKKFLDSQSHKEAKENAPATPAIQEAPTDASELNEAFVSPEVNKPQKRSRGRSPKPVPETLAESQSAEPIIPDILEVRAAIQKVIDKHGMVKAQSFIQEFGKLKYSEIPKERWREVIARAKELT
jgi:uncharacterized membrane protein